MRLAHKIPIIYDGKKRYNPIERNLIEKMRKYQESKFNQDWKARQGSTWISQFMLEELDIENNMKIRLLQNNNKIFRGYDYLIQNEVERVIISENINYTNFMQIKNIIQKSIQDNKNIQLWVYQIETTNEPDFVNFIQKYNQYIVRINTQNNYNPKLQQQTKNYLNYHSNQQNLSIPSPSLNQEWEFIILGTASAMVTPNRNTSAYLIKKLSKSWLIQCGPNTHIQLYKKYQQKYFQIISTIQGIFISHFHNDHHFGLMQIIYDLSQIKQLKQKKRKIILLLPKSLISYITYFIEITKSSDCFQIVNTLDYYYKHTSIKKISSSPFQFEIFKTQHCFGSFGIIFKLISQKIPTKIVYPGDTPFSFQVAKAAKKATLLIHESTFLKSQESSHCKIQQTLKIAQLAQVQKLLITHFSRYFIADFRRQLLNNKFLINNKQKQVLLNFFNKNTVIAYDLDILNPSNLEQMVKKTQNRLKTQTEQN